MKEIYVGNLYFDVSTDDVRDLFTPYGMVHEVKLIAERTPGHPHAFAFIEMEDMAADIAIAALDGVEFMGLTLRVEEAKPEARLSEQGIWQPLPHA